MRRLLNFIIKLGVIFAYHKSYSYCLGNSAIEHSWDILTERVAKRLSLMNDLTNILSHIKN